MDDAIGQKDWMEVGQLMGQSQCSEAQRRRVVEEASQHAGEQHLMTFILPALTEGELHHVLKVLFTRRLWPAVGKVLSMNVSDALNAQILTEAMDTEDDTVFSEHILPSCNGGQLDSFMMQMITSGQNSSVRKLLQTVGDEKPVWSIGKEHMDRKLLQRVAEEQWWGVGEYLQGLNDLQCRWVIEIACERASDRDISSCILPQCADEQLDIMLTTLVTRGFLQSVDTILKGGVSPVRHMWAIREICRWADEENVDWYMQTHCSDQQLEEGKTRLVTRGLWETVDIMLNHGISPARQFQAIQGACQRADEDKFESYILPHCSEDQIDDVLRTLVTRGLWRSVGKVLSRAVNPARHNWVIHEACGRAEDEDIEQWILPHCTDEQLDGVLTTLVARGLWGPEDTMWHCGVSPAPHDWSVNEDSPQAGEEQAQHKMLPRGAIVEHDDELTTFVTQGLWQSVDTVLRRGVSPARHAWVIQEACREADEKDLQCFILPHCNDEQLDDVLTTVVTRGLWETVDMMLKHGISPARHVQVIHEACQWTDEEDFESYILPHCSEEQLDGVLKMLVTRGLWRSVGKVLSRTDNPTRHSWVIHEACGRAEDEDIEQWILPHCTDEQLDGVLTTLITRGLWGSEDTVMSRGVSSAPHDRSASEDSLEVGEEQAQRNMLPCSAVDEHDDELTTFVTQGLWQSVDTKLQSGVSRARCMWTIYEACRQADEKDLQRYILPHCDDEQLDDVLITLVTRGLWETVDTVLRRGVSPARHSQAINEACQWADDESFELYILPHCDEGQLDYVLRTLVMRGLWMSAVTALTFTDNPDSHSWVMLKACQQADDEDIRQWILPNCTDEQLDKVWTTLVARGLWESVDTLWHSGVSPAPYNWLISEDCLQSDEEDVQSDMLLHSSDEEHDDELTTFVTQGLWQFVDTVLCRGVSPTRHTWAIHEACQQAGEADLEHYVLAHCDDELRDDVLTTLVTRGLWKSVSFLLQKGVSPTRHTWAIHEACQQAGDTDLEHYILAHCDDELRDNVLTTLVTRGLWKSVGYVLQKGVIQDKHRWAIRKVFETENSSFIAWCMLPPRDYIEEGSFKHFRAEDIARLGVDCRDVWGRLAVSVSLFVMSTFSSWLGDTEDEESIESAFWDYVTNPHCKHSDLCQFLMQLRRLKTVVLRRVMKSGYEKSGQNSGKKMSTRLLITLHASLLWKAVIHFMTETWVSEQSQDTQCSTEGIKEQAMQMCIQIQEQIVKRKSFPELFGAIRELCSQGTGSTDRQNPLFALHFIKNLVQLLTEREVMSTTLEVLTCVPVIPDLQSVALTEMQESNRWDVIRRADLSAVWEQVRRRLLTAATKQGQWDVVAQWANYTLYDDQCLEALEEAYTHKQWRTYLLLADYGPMEVELMRVHYRLTRYAPWDVVLEMFERGADLIECQEGVRPGKKLRILNQKKDDNERRPRYVKLLLLQKEWEARMVELKSLKSALEKQEWSVALYEINRRHRREEIVLGLKAALVSEVWHVVIYLIRQGIGPRLCDRLFREMMRRQQWDVCRVLLEEGVDPQLALDALPQLMEQNQWTLVARLMEYDVGDALRRQVMKQALDRREGSVVWQCIINMEHDHLSVEERQELFYEAFNRENWQAVKPLVEVKDDTGIRHRDAALLEAIEQHQWDVVDHCLLFRANINMLDDDNHTPMHRMAMRRDWEAVEELIKRGGDPNLLDEDGLSVFHRVVLAGEWKLAKMLIEYHGDIHRRAQKQHIERTELRTPLEMLIDARQVEVIQHTFMWCPDQGEGVNDAGETTLHVACLAGSVPMLYDQVARRADPLAVTVRGHSALSYAVMCGERAQETVAECIRLGFSTHQPHLTDCAMDTDWPSDSDSVSLGDIDITDPFTSILYSSDDTSDSEDPADGTRDDRSDSTISTGSDFSDLGVTCDDNDCKYSGSLLSSCMLLAVLRGLPVVAQMLYESGACSYRELFRLRTPLLCLALLVPRRRWRVELSFKSLLEKIYKRSNKVPPSQRCLKVLEYEPDRERVQECAHYLLEVSTTPRSLKATCRHVISRCLGLHKKRGEHVKQLPLMRSMRRYVMFSDLTHLECGRYTHRQTLEEFLALDLEAIHSLYADDDSEREDTSEEEESSSDETHTSEEDIYRDLYPDEEESDDDDNGVLADEEDNNIDRDNCDDNGVLADEEENNIDRDNCDDNGVLADQEDNTDSDNYDDNGVPTDQEDNTDSDNYDDNGVLTDEEDNTDSDNYDDSEAETDEENEDETASQ